MVQRQDKITHPYEADTLRDALSRSTVTIETERPINGGHQFALDDGTILDLTSNCLITQRHGTRAHALHQMLLELKDTPVPQVNTLRPRVTFIGTSHHVLQASDLRNLCERAGFNIQIILVNRQDLANQLAHWSAYESVSKKVSVMVGFDAWSTGMNSLDLGAVLVALARGRSWKDGDWGDVVSLDPSPSDPFPQTATPKPWSTIRLQLQSDDPRDSFDEESPCVDFTKFAGFLDRNCIETADFLVETDHLLELFEQSRENS